MPWKLITIHHSTKTKKSSTIRGNSTKTQQPRNITHTQKQFKMVSTFQRIQTDQPTTQNETLIFHSTIVTNNWYTPSNQLSNGPTNHWTSSWYTPSTQHHWYRNEPLIFHSTIKNNSWYTPSTHLTHRNEPLILHSTIITSSSWYFTVRS